MSLTRTVPVWIARSGPMGAHSSLALASDETLLGAPPGVVAARLRAHLQKAIWDGDDPGALLDRVPEVQVTVGPVLPLTLPARRDGHPAVELPVATLLVRSPTGSLAVAPELGAAWPGATEAEAIEGLAEWAKLELGTRPESPEGLELLELANAGPVEVSAEVIELVLPTFSELREHARREGRVLARVAPVAAIGQAWHIDDRIDALMRPLLAGRSAILVGPRGAGKTACVRALARYRWRANMGERELREIAAPTFLLDLLDIGGSWQEGLARVCAELKEREDWLYVTRLAELFEVGRYEGNSTSVGEYLRPWLGRGDVRLISECTPEELAILEARYPGALDGIVRVPFAEPADLPGILGAWARNRAGPAFVEDALAECVRLHRRFMPYSGLPGRAIRFLDAFPTEPGPAMDRDAIYAAFCAESGLPRALVDPRATLSPETVHDAIAARVYGQPDAVTAVVDALLAIKADVARWGKPLASMLLVGPTGVGKTEMARAIAAFLFGSASRMIRFDMSEYASPATVLRLVDGANGEGQLTSAVRRQPFSVVLLDEVEKAHPAVLDLLLQVLGEGRLTDGGGRVTDFSSTLVLLTSNVGSAEARRGMAGFGRTDAPGQRYLDAVRAWLRPEMLNRLDRILAFAPLDAASIDRVLDRELAAFRQRPGLAAVPLEIDAATRARIGAAGFDPRWGGRQLLRAVHEQLATPLAAALDAAKVRSPGAVLVAGSPQIYAGPQKPPLLPNDEAYVLAHRCEAAVERLARGSGMAQLRTLLRTTRPDPNPARFGEWDRLRALVQSVDALAEEATRLVIDAGAAAIEERLEEDIGRRVQEQRTALRKALRAVHQRLNPTEESMVVGVYGSWLLGYRDRVVGMYASAARALGMSVTSGFVHPPVRTPGAPDYVHWALPGRDAKTAVGAEVGVELLVRGFGVGLLFAGEVGVLAVPPPLVQKAQRLRVVATAATEETWPQRRPKGFERQHFLDAGTVIRTFDGELRDERADVTLPNLGALEERLIEVFYERLAEELE